jgi:hypothetical protein
VIRPFGLNDILLVRRLQRRGTFLAIEQFLTHPREPLWVALTAPWPWAGVGVATYVLDEKTQESNITGFVQLMKRAARPEADLLHIAPAFLIGEANRSPNEDIWCRLLAHCCLAAASHGLQRLFVSIPEGGPEQVCLKEAGFSLYAQETIYRLASITSVDDVEPLGIRAQFLQDSWALQRLYFRSTPHLVQQAEGALTGRVGSPPLSWWEPDRWQGLVWEPAGEVRGAVQVHLGRAGHWLRIWGTNGLTARELCALIGAALRRIAANRSRWRRASVPIYVVVRDYEYRLGSALAGYGFSPYLNRTRFVKHTVAAIRSPLPTGMTAMEGRQEVPVRSQAHSSGDIKKGNFT